MRDDQLGPITAVVAELAGGRFSDRGSTMLLEAVDRGLVRVLDLEFVTKDEGGTVRGIPLSAVPTTDGVDLSVWDGASSGLLDESDVQQAGADIAPGGIAAVLVLEDVWVVSLVEALGARLVSAEGVSAEAVVAALDATESRSS